MCYNKIVNKNLVMIHLEDNELFKEGVIEMLEKEEETEKLIIDHKDDNIILNFIYNIYAGKYKVLNNLLDKTPCNISYDYDDDIGLYSFEIEYRKSFRRKDKKENWIISITAIENEAYFEYDGEQINIWDYSEEQLLNLLLKELNKHLNSSSNLKKSFNPDFVAKVSNLDKIMIVSAWIISILGLVTISILLILKRIDKSFYKSLFIPLILFFIVFGLFTLEVLVSKLELKKERLTYTNAFGKKKYCYIDQISTIKHECFGRKAALLFLNKNNEIIMKINAGRFLSSDNNVLNKLKNISNYYHIKFIR